MTDWIDQAQLVEQRAREVSLRAIQRQAAAQGHPRLTRVCLACADPIEPERIAACPGASRCIDCQRTLDRRRRLFPE